MGGAPVRVRWYQSRSTLSLHFSVVADAAVGEASVELTAERLYISWPGAKGAVEFEQAFLHPVVATDSPETKQNPGKLAISLKKAKAAPYWKYPFTCGKVAWVVPEWDRWVDEDDVSDDDEPPNMMALADKMVAAKKTADKEAAEAPPEMEVAPLAEGWEEAWGGFSSPTRMVTMALCWNCQAESTRLTSAKRLIEILRQSGGELADVESRFKGGEAIVRSLDTSVYNSVPRPTPWLVEFCEMSAEGQVDLMAGFFDRCSLEEQRLIVTSTFI